MNTDVLSDDHERNVGQHECVNLFVFVCCAEVSTGSVTKGEGRIERERERAEWFLGSVLPTPLIHRHSSCGSRAVLEQYKSDIYLIKSSLVQSPEESELRQSPLKLHGRVGCRQTRW